jgi:hypothetical protein
MFVVESVQDSALGGDSVEAMLPIVRSYFQDFQPTGELQTRLRCRGTADLLGAINEFVTWTGNRPPDDPKWLWISLHGKKPARPQQVGTHGVAIAVSLKTGGAHVATREDFDWHKIFAPLAKTSLSNVVIVMDVCCGGSPSAPARATGISGGPSYLFGPSRSAHRLELNTATALLTSIMRNGTLPTITEAKEIVSILNRSFPKDPESGKEFYRAWWWEDGHQRCFPKPSEGTKRVSPLHSEDSPIETLATPE